MLGAADGDQPWDGSNVPLQGMVNDVVENYFFFTSIMNQL